MQLFVRKWKNIIPEKLKYKNWLPNLSVWSASKTVTYTMILVQDIENIPH